MRLTTKFQLATKSKHELRGLYRNIFNKVANPKLSASERRAALNLLAQIKRLLPRR